MHASVKDSWYLNDQFTLFPGLSVSAEDYLDGDSVEPRFAIEYTPRDELILSAANGLYLEVLNLLDRKNLSYYEYNADYSERTAVAQLPRIIGIAFHVDL